MTADRQREAAGLITAVAARLKRGDAGERRREARLLLALAVDREDPVLPHEDIALDQAQAAHLDTLINRRNDGEPVSRLRGWREFYSLRFGLNAATLDPRPDSEVLVETGLMLAETMPAAISIVDFGTGSGCLLLALLAHLPEARGIGVDVNPEAIAAARANAESLSLAGRSRWSVSDWDSSLAEERFDLVISNPPYIPRLEIDSLEPEVRLHDPLLALDGGDDGLVVWRLLLPVIAGRLNPGGRAVVEIGHGQAEDVTGLAIAAGLDTLSTHADLAGRTRCLVLAKTA
ncbi:MAG: peptide chain release factor N(5)-glutamine methyltransferase [Candidatus Puniceispirillales bacterium]